MQTLNVTSQARALPANKRSAAAAAQLTARPVLLSAKSAYSLQTADVVVPAAAARTAIIAQAVKSAAKPADVVITFDPKAEVAAQFDRWNAALQTLEPTKVADLYAPDAVLLPTVSNIVRTDRDAIVDYFTSFLKIKPRGVIDESTVRMLSDTVASHAGIYTFTITKDGRDQQVQARFSFIYRKIGNEWKIAEHHSSAMPEHAEVAAQFDKWNAALATLNPEKVADCYGPGAVLLPTVSNQVRTNRAAIVDYFTSFLKLKPQGVIDQANVRVLANGVAMYAGIYTFTLHKETGPTKVQARFSYTYKKFGGDYKIIEHHSSAMPEPVAASANAENN